MRSLSILAAVLPVVLAAPPIPTELLPRASGPAAGTIITKCANSNHLALAFDDGPWQYEESLLATLNAAGAKATFFVTGTLYGCIYDRSSTVKAAYNAGHQIASHTWAHKSMGSLSTTDITSEMTKLETAFANILGIKPTYMRPPYLDTGGSVVSTMKTLGYRIVTDDVDSQDWNGKTAAQSEAIFTAAGPGPHIPLMHETVQTTVTTLVPWLINWAKSNGLSLVTVATCLNDDTKGYTTSATKTGATTC